MVEHGRFCLEKDIDLRKVTTNGKHGANLIHNACSLLYTVHYIKICFAIQLTIIMSTNQYHLLISMTAWNDTTPATRNHIYYNSTSTIRHEWGMILGGIYCFHLVRYCFVIITVTLSSPKISTHTHGFWRRMTKQSIQKMGADLGGFPTCNFCPCMQ